MSRISLIFPMAGQGARFGYRFKPFLEFNGVTFIAAAFAPFRPWLQHIEKIYFVYLQDQEDTHHVSARLSAMFGGIDFVPVILDRPTPGPAQTLFRCLAQEAIGGPLIVCDCDHAFDVGQLMQAMIAPPPASCVLPTWDLTEEAVAAWSIVAINQQQIVTSIAEKQVPAQGEMFRGVIGCYGFSDASHLRMLAAAHPPLYLSDIVRHYLETGMTVHSVPVTEARFFGDPARLQQAAAAPPARFMYPCADLSGSGGRSDVQTVGDDVLGSIPIR